MMNFINIISGSKGNASILYDDKDVILIDSGMSKRDLVATLKKINRTLDDISLILITHNHSDHIKNLKYFLDYPIYSLKETLSKNIKVNYLELFREINIGKFTITPIEMSHDAKNTSGFIFKHKDLIDEEETLGFVTDTGYLSQKDLSYLKNLDYYYFESNYDEYLLLTSKRTYALNSRNLSITGHLSNKLASRYLTELVSKKTKKIMLAHLSEECNTEDIALSTIKDIFEEYKPEINENGIEIVCCNQHKPTYLKEIDND